MKLFAIIFAAVVLLFACNGSENTSPVNTTDHTSNTTDTLSLKRGNVQANAVASFSVPVPNELNKWQFAIALYETEDRFTYRVKMEYEEVRGEDMITFPNLGFEPKPLIQKGNGQYECIIGFLDKERKFREYKEVSVKNETLKMTTLKYYSVSR